MQTLSKILDRQKTSIYRPELLWNPSKNENIKHTIEGKAAAEFLFTEFGISVTVTGFEEGFQAVLSFVVLDGEEFPGTDKAIIVRVQPVELPHH